MHTGQICLVNLNIHPNPPWTNTQLHKCAQGYTQINTHMHTCLSGLVRLRSDIHCWTRTEVGDKDKMNIWNWYFTFNWYSMPNVTAKYWASTGVGYMTGQMLLVFQVMPQPPKYIWAFNIKRLGWAKQIFLGKIILENLIFLAAPLNSVFNETYGRHVNFPPTHTHTHTPSPVLCKDWDKNDLGQISVCWIVGSPMIDKIFTGIAFFQFAISPRMVLSLSKMVVPWVQRVIRETNHILTNLTQSNLCSVE